MNVRCPYCRHSFNLSRDYLVQAVAEADEKRQKYDSVECLNCRKQIKVPISQMRHFVPPTTETEEEVPADQAPAD